MNIVCCCAIIVCVVFFYTTAPVWRGRGGVCVGKKGEQNERRDEKNEILVIVWQRGEIR